MRYQRERKFIEAATCLQKYVRRYLAKSYVERIRAERSQSPIDHEKRRLDAEQAAIVIQRQIRKLLAIRRVERIRAQREELRQIKEKYAAIKIQRFYRSHKLERSQRFEEAAVCLQVIRKLVSINSF